MIEDLKKSVLLQIEDTIETLQLRILLNQQTILEEEKELPELKKALDYFNSMNYQNQQAQKVIQECKSTIKKLVLLKDFLPDLSLNAAVSLLNNYEDFNFEAFKKQLQHSLTRELPG